MTPLEYMSAARVPESLKPQRFGLWTIERLAAGCAYPNEKLQALGEAEVGWPSYTLLRRVSARSLHLEDAGEIVMEDSARELRKHLPIWMAAHGRVLVTGLGLGCVVRGLLAKSEVERVDVVEIDGRIIRVVWPEFAKDPRAQIHHGDALRMQWPPEARWDFAWHDLWTDGDRHLQHLHADLIAANLERCASQGAWAFPRQVKRKLRRHLGNRIIG